MGSSASRGAFYKNRRLRVTVPQLQVSRRAAADDALVHQLLDVLSPVVGHFADLMVGGVSVADFLRAIFPLPLLPSNPVPPFRVQGRSARKIQGQVNPDVVCVAHLEVQVIAIAVHVAHVADLPALSTCCPSDTFTPLKWAYRVK